MVSSRSTSAIVARARLSDVVSSTAGDVGPCSACPSRSVAQSSASTLSSAMTSVSVGTGEEIDADAAEQLALCLRDEGVAGADHHIDGCDALGAERHGADRLHAAEAVDHVRAGEMLRRHDRRRGLALDRAARR